MADKPTFASTPVNTVGQVSVANTNRDGTGTLATIYTAPSTGARIRRIRVVATGTTTAGMVRIFLHDGANARLLFEIPVTAVTPSATQQAFSSQLTEGYGVEMPMALEANESIRASTHNAETFNVFVEGAAL